MKEPIQFMEKPKWYEIPYICFGSPNRATGAAVSDWIRTVGGFCVALVICIALVDTTT